MASDIAIDLPGLATVGVDNHLWDIRRFTRPSDEDPTASIQGVFLEKWSTRRIICRTVDDFQSEDEEWLMRHHPCAQPDNHIY